MDIVAFLEVHNFRPLPGNDSVSVIAESSYISHSYGCYFSVGLGFFVASASVD